ncbi:MAG: thioredoxin domain-containing protein [Bacteroidetes bacterium]|nr:thioredoxin domain-containing protein [Bacteroidota bacterium]
MEKQFTNRLIDETSPYLLQHAHNPVNWLPWGDEAWNLAKTENKLVLISIGYSSCHWCHVMEHETFEDTAAAKLMNEHFVCIKVDREERPDIDHVYMSAVQLMTNQGGWPLNCICLPSGKPIYGGTYFQNAQWQNILTQLYDFYLKNPAKAEEYAEELTQGIRQMELVQQNTDEISFSKEELKPVVENWKKHFDHVEGGPNRAPKFPMPNNYDFLMHYAVAEKDEALKDYVLLTLDKMAFGGIYDQVGGGFARYSTDSLWKVPHFEKMLYDNAQLVSLYSHAYQLTKKDLYKQVVYETLNFIEREMTSTDGGFYSALDADSEGVEGKFYVWTKAALENILGEKFNAFADYYNVNQIGFWEHDNYVLLRKETDDVIASRQNISVQKLNDLISESKKILLAERNKRTRPGLDDKQLTSWNALIIKGYCDAYEAFGEIKFLDAGLKCAEHILQKAKHKNGSLTHIIPKKNTLSESKRSLTPSPSPARMNLRSDGERAGERLEAGRGAGFLEDYSFFIEALIKLYETTFEEKYLDEAKHFVDYALAHFFDEQTGMFFFTSNLDSQLIARKKEIHDNVTPASNSSMAKALFLLGKYFDDKKYLHISKTLLHNVKNEMARYGSSFSNWCELMMWNTYPFYEIAIAGKKAEEKRKELTGNYLPNKILSGAMNGNSKLTILENRFVDRKTIIYVCENKTCNLPVEQVSQVISQLR